MTEFLTFFIDKREINIEPVYTTKEVNFIAYDKKAYLFRLVPGKMTSSEFDISPLDKCLDIKFDRELAGKLGSEIENYFE